MDNLSWLMRWFGGRCDGAWESECGITIETVDNPGWMVRIDLDGTGLDPSSFRPVAVQRTESDWVECKVADGLFYAGAGVNNLDEVLGIFRRWVEGGGHDRGSSGHDRNNGGRDRSGSDGSRRGGRAERGRRERPR
ncbi:MAG: immunity 53 family protein [Tepidisphaerales bacterium]